VVEATTAPPSREKRYELLIKALNPLLLVARRRSEPPPSGAAAI
jgi:hypothetical protein